MTSDNYVQYETLTKDIYRALYKVENVKSINIQHNVMLEGKSGCKHQIDIYCELEIIAEIHKVAIECKDYATRINLGRVRDFHSVLRDVGDIKGIMVTKVGYQSGAAKYADFYGIVLKELRFPTDSDWEGRIRDIVVEMERLSIRVKEVEPQFNIEWLKNNKSVKIGQLVHIALTGRGNLKKMIIYDETNKRITDLYELESKLPHNNRKEYDLEYSREFNNGYIDTEEYGRIKIDAIKFYYDIDSKTIQIINEGEEIAKAILKDVKSGDITFFDKEGEIR